MLTKKDAFLWQGLANIMLFINMPLGIYTWLQGGKLMKSYKIGDEVAYAKYKKHIKTAWICESILIGLLIILIIFTA